MHLLPTRYGLLPLAPRLVRLAASLVLTAIVMGVAAVPNARADEEGPTWLDLAGPPDPADRAVQKRKHQLSSEFTLLVGVLPSDPFYKGLTFNAGYTLHFNNYVGWEMASFTYSQDFDTDLKRQLVRIILSGGVVPPPLPEVTGALASHLVIKPFYGKQAFMDVTLAHVEAYLQLGPAAMLLTESAGKAFAIGLDWGVGIRVWLGDVVSLRLQLGQMVYVAAGPRQALHAEGGFAFNVGGDE